MNRLRCNVFTFVLRVTILLVFVASPTGNASAAENLIRVREDTDTLSKPESKAKLDALKLAFKTLQESTDPTKNMDYWANIHGAPLGDVSTGPYEHNSKLIWAWHRAYLYEFETALRDSHPPETKDVTLPYWNWAAPPTGSRYPKAFEEAGSPLSYEFRTPNANPSPPLPPDVETTLVDVSDWRTFGSVPKETVTHVSGLHCYLCLRTVPCANKAVQPTSPPPVGARAAELGRSAEDS